MASAEAVSGSASREELPGLKWAVAWYKGHQRAATGIGIAVVAAVGLSWWTAVSKGKVEAAASQKLSEARLALESHNYPLAASELAQVVENYSGSKAAEQANLLLAETRLDQGQTEQAIDLLKRITTSTGRDFVAQAYGLLGAAYENAERPQDAATAYETAATHAQFPFQRAQYLSEAGRCWTVVGDTAKAVADYLTIVSKMDSTQSLMEAKVRLGELLKGVLPAP